MITNLDVSELQSVGAGICSCIAMGNVSWVFGSRTQKNKQRGISCEVTCCRGSSFIAWEHIRGSEVIARGDCTENMGTMGWTGRRGSQ